MVPSARVVVPSNVALTPAPPCGAPVVRTGGQYCTQLGLLQLDTVPLSARNRYTVRPLGSIRTSPSFVLPTAIAVPAAAGAAPGAPVGALLGGWLAEP